MLFLYGEDKSWLYDEFKHWVPLLLNPLEMTEEEKAATRARLNKTLCYAVKFMQNSTGQTSMLTLFWSFVVLDGLRSIVSPPLYSNLNKPSILFIGPILRCFTVDCAMQDG